MTGEAKVNRSLKVLLDESELTGTSTRAATLT